MKLPVLLVQMLLFGTTTVASSAAIAQPSDEWFEQYKWEWDCKIVSGQSISNNIATGQVTSGPIPNLEVGRARLTMEVWSKQDQSETSYTMILMPSGGPEQYVLITDLDQYGIGDANLYYANDEYGGMYLRKTSENEWHGFVSQYEFLENPERGDQLTTFVRALECNGTQVSN